MKVRICILILLITGPFCLDAQFQPPAGSDTTSRDTSRGIIPKQKDVERRTEIMDPNRYSLISWYRTRAGLQFDSFTEYDEVRQAEGFAQTLGQTGKYYRRYVHGAPASFFNTGAFTNRLSGVEELYMLNPESQINYYDTRTPYVRVNYHQGLRDLNKVSITASQNISPFVNIALFYRHRTATGAYFNNSTDDYNIYISGQGHTPDKRYQVFVNGTLNQLFEALNGGTPSNLEYQNSFEKQRMSVVLEGAKDKRWHQALLVRQFYRFFDDSTRSRHKFQVEASGSASQFLHQFSDATFNSGIQELPVPAYPTLLSGYTSIFEKIIIRSYEGKAGGTYRFRDDQFSFYLNPVIRYENRRYLQPGFVSGFLRQEDRNGAILRTGMDWEAKGSQVRADLEAGGNVSTLFNRQSHLSGDFGATLGNRLIDEVLTGDSVVDPVTGKWYRFRFHRPWDLSLSFLRKSRNPSYFQYAYSSGEQLAYSGNSGFENENLIHLRGALRYSSAEQRSKKNNQQLHRRYIEAGGFFSSLERMIWYDSSMVIHQAAAGNSFIWTGLSVDFRYNLGKFYFQNKTTLQQGIISEAGDFREFYEKSLPRLFGEAQIFFEQREASFAEIFRVALKARYFSPFQPLNFDPSTQQFYAPTVNWVVPGYVNMGFEISSRIKGVYLYARLYHLNEGFVLPGYWTTPYYPMLERNFIFGVDWSFFD